jgi:hypothetical protein
MASPESSRRQVPFGGHQLAEYTIAAALFGVGIHVSGRPEFVLIAGGGVIGAMAFVTKGPLAAVKLLPKRLHLSLDLVVAALFAISPLFYLHDLQIIPIILCEAVAVLLVRMSFTTEIVPRPHPERTGPPSRAARLGALMSHGTARTQTARMPPAAATAPAAAATPVTAAGPAAARQPATGTAATPQTGNPADAVAGVASTAGWVVGAAVAKARSSGAPSSAARGLGRATGHARRIGRAAKEARSAPGGPQPIPPGSTTQPD